MGHAATRVARVEWVDRAKGLTILLVVILHATYAVELHLGKEGWMHHVYAFATPFRMPVFFAVAGLFAAQAISKEWRTFLDGKFAHFAYFYVLWLTIQFIFKTPFFLKDFGVEGTLGYYLLSFVQPFGLLWFIYLLPIYFFALRLTQKIPVILQFIVAILLKSFATETGVGVIDFFAKYYIFFLIGHFGSSIWFRVANWAQDHRLTAAGAVTLWALANGMLVYAGYDGLPLMTIMLGALGLMAVTAFMAILPARGLAQVFHYCGQRSLPIYLGFFLPMGVTRISIPALCDSCGPGMTAFLVSLASILGALVMYELVMRFKIGTFLYVRPDWARIKKRKTALIAAE